MSPFPLSLFTLLSVAACAPVSPHGLSPDVGEDDTTSHPPEPQIRVGRGLDGAPCNAEAAQGFVGQMPSEATVQSAVDASGAKTVRVIGHGMMVTMDYRGDRLNVHLDEAGKIVRVTCG